MKKSKKIALEDRVKKLEKQIKDIQDALINASDSFYQATRGPASH